MMTDDDLLMEILDDFDDRLPRVKEQAIEAKIEDCIQIFVKRFNKPIEFPEIRYDLKGRVAGQSRSDGVIRVNRELAKGKYWDDMLNKTIPHETAHHAQWTLFPGSQAHGKHWAYLMYLLGLPAERCHSYEVKPAFTKSRPYVYTCGCREFKMTLTLHRRMTQGRHRTCKSCKTRLYYVRTEGE